MYRNYSTEKVKIVRTKLLLCSFVCLFLLKNSHSQDTLVRSVKIKKEITEADFLPRISGVLDGEINVLDFCNGELKNNVGYKVITYNIQYSYGGMENVHRIVGNHIPDSICVQIASFGIGQEVFFTKIKAMTKDGHIVHLDNLRLTPIREDE